MISSLEGDVGIYDSGSLGFSRDPACISGTHVPMEVGGKSFEEVFYIRNLFF